MTTIYLSSTYEDLKEYRDVVFKTLRKSGYDVIAMEDYIATDQRPADKCLKDVSEADIYVGIFAFRYGYVPPAGHNNLNGLSITELEFRQAESLKKPCLTFVVSQTTPWQPNFMDSQTAEGKGERINKFREYLLTERMASAFSSPHELAALVLTAVTRHQEGKKKTEDASQQKTERAPAIIWDIAKDESPYPGLMHFTRKYAPVFFGRDAEVVEVLDRIRLPEGRFLIISGGSGSGKSSLVDAGVLPKIEENGLGDAITYVCARMVPSQGNNPFDALLRPLHGYVERAELKVYELADEMAKQPNILPEKIQEIVTKGLNGKGLVLFLDQMEELFTAQNPDMSNKFLAALFGAVQTGSLRVLATIRSDHLHHCHAHPEMLRILRGPGNYPLGPVEPFMLSDIIVKPAQCAGLSVNETLARRIVDDTGTEPGSLPLLAFAMNQLFEKRFEHELSEAVYKSLGGVVGAIAQHAANVETTIRREQGAKAFDLLPKLFQALVIVKEESLPTRRRPLASDFPPEMGKLIDTLVRKRLLRTEGNGKDATVSLSHEKLFDTWPSLRDYVATNKKTLMDQTLLESRARKWVDMGKPWFSGLASHREYKDFLRVSVPTPQAKRYFGASKRALWIRAGGTAILTLAFLVIEQAWQRGLSVDHTILKWRSMFMSVYLEPKMADIEGGIYSMGDFGGLGNSTERPVHEVKIKRFAIGRYEVTFDEYDRYALAEGKNLPPDNDPPWGRARRPVINVSWDDAQAYAKWLSDKTDKRYRLPTEAEWEYAARSGGKNEKWSGSSDENQLVYYAVLRTSQTEPVGSRKPNGLGLYDMSGNVYEWVEDCWHNNYDGAPKDGSAWLQSGGGECQGRVERGGSWENIPDYVRSSFRLVGIIRGRSKYIGFRLAQDIP